MQIQPIAMLQHNTSAASAQAQASSASFDRMLEEAKRSAQDARNAAASGDGTQAARAEDKALKKACEGFEAMFLNMMYRQMRSTVHEGGLFGEDNGGGRRHRARRSALQAAPAAGRGEGRSAGGACRACTEMRRKEQQ